VRLEVVLPTVEHVVLGAFQVAIAYIAYRAGKNSR
jgi:hypothetical protein